jgi:Beta-galactosidase trimerisation domain
VKLISEGTAVNRRDFVKQASILPLAGLTVHPGMSAQSRIAHDESGSKRLKHGPAWLAETPLVIAGNHDSIPIFRRRIGGGTVEQEEEFEKSHSEDFARKIKEAGITLWITYYYKGFGVEAERQYMEITKTFVPVLHKHGIKVGVYIGSTMAYETFLAERPDAAEWLVPDYLGKPVIYFDQTFRRRVYFMHPGYVEYMKRVVHSAVVDAKVDLIHFDNTSLQAEPEIFLHPLAIKDFRQYLKTKYTPQELEKRFGFSDVRYMTPPEVDFSLTTIDDPFFQEWAGFRCHQLERYYAIMEQVIRSANSETAVESNPHSEISGRNTIWEQGVYYPKLLSHMDAVWSEEGDPAGVNDLGILVSRIRSFKNASILGNTLFVVTGGPSGSTLQIAESMAFGRQCMGDIGIGTMDQNIPADQRRYLSFFREQFEYYKEVESLADVAVLYSYASMGFNNDGPAVSFMLFTQALIQAKVPFDIIFDEHLEDLSKYRALVLADQECLSEEQMGMIRRYVEQGGGLVATEQTSMYTPWRLQRADFGLKDLFGVEAPKAGFRGRQRGQEITPVQNRIGQGRVSYVAAVKAAIEKPAGARMTSQYWKLPLNWEEMIEQVRWAAGGKFTLEVEAPGTLAVAAEQQEQAGEDRRLVHLLNYAAPQGRTVSNVKVEVELPDGKGVRRATLLTPDGQGKVTVSSRVADGRARFTVPRLETYTLAVLDLRSL